MHYTTRRISN